MIKVRTAQAEWKGNLREGQGTVRFGDGAFESSYTWDERFGEATGTNPEQLLGAAHAACFSMALSANLTTAGFPPDRIASTANVHLEKLDSGWTVTRVHLETEATVPGIESAAFQELAEKAKVTCPISRALGAIDIELTARLSGG